MMEWCWHGYHQGPSPLFMLKGTIEERRQQIRRTKPEAEQAVRQSLLQPVRGQLPAPVLVARAVYAQAYDAYAQAYDAYTQAGAVYAQACDAYTQARAVYAQARAVNAQAGAVYAQAYDVYTQAQAVYDQARAVYTQAQAVYDQAMRDNMPAILALHAQECPDCPWDGDTIFPKVKKEATA